MLIVRLGVTVVVACSGCPSRAVVYHQQGRDGEPVLDGSRSPPAPCRHCRQPACVLQIVVVYDPDFFGNAERPEERMTERAGPARRGET